MPSCLDSLKSNRCHLGVPPVQETGVSCEGNSWQPWNDHLVETAVAESTGCIKERQLLPCHLGATACLSSSPVCNILHLDETLP